MNKKFLKVISFILSVMMIFSCAIVASAEGDAPVVTERIRVRIRVEGLTSQLASKDVYVNKSSTVKAVIDGAGLDVFYAPDSLVINSVKSELAVTASKWQYAVDGAIRKEAIDAYTLDKNCEIVLFNASENAVMPSIVADDVASSGVLKINGTDKNGVVAPIADAEITWETKTGDKTFTTDAKGQIYLAEDDVTKGKHDVQIKKCDANNVPVVVRFDKGAELEVTDSVEAPIGGTSIFMQVYNFIYDILKGVIEVWAFYLSEIGKLLGIVK